MKTTTNAPKLSASYLYAGHADGFGGHGCDENEDHTEVLLYAYYGRETTLRDIIDELVSDACNGCASETLPDDVTEDAVRTALLDMLSDAGLSAYEHGELAAEAADLAAEWDSDDEDDYYESPVYIVLLDCVNTTRRTEGPVLIGRKGEEYWFLDSVFWHGSDLKGCTGTTAYPVSEEHAEYLLSADNMGDRYGDVWEEGYSSYCREDCENCSTGVDEEGCEDCGYPSLKSWCAEIAQYDGIDAVIDNPGNDYCEAMVEKGANAEYADCSGCGRIFGRNGVNEFDEVYNRKALVACLAYEDGAVDYDYAVKAIYG